MRLVYTVLALLASFPALADVSGPCPKGVPVNITTPTLSHNNVIVEDEETAAGTVSYIVKAENGQISIPKSIVTKCDPVTTIPVNNPVAPRPTPGPSLSVDSLDLRLHGSNTIGARLAPALAKAYAEKSGLSLASENILRSEEVDVEYGKAESTRRFIFRFETYGSATAFESLLASAADIGMASRRANEKEQTSLSQAGLGNLTAAKVENVIALDGLAIVVNKDNPVQALTLDQIAEIFSGQITNWERVGGPSAPIALYARDAKSGTFDTFKNLVLEKDKDRRRELSASAKRFEASDELSDAVAGDPNGIGFIGLAYVRNAKALSIATSCDLRFAPDKFEVRTEEYPLARRLYFYTPDKMRIEPVNAFLQFVLSEEGQSIVEAQEFVGLNVEASSRDYVLDRGQYWRLAGPTTWASAPIQMKNFSQRIADAARLSITFRFKSGSTELDNRSLEDVGRLASYVKSKPGLADRIMLFGFADTMGNPQDNLTLSRERAVQVADALGAQGVSMQPAQIQGFGIIAPVACNNSEAALAKNRRVEVWLRR